MAGVRYLNDRSNRDRQSRPSPERSWCEDYQVVVAVAAALGGLKIVGLRGLDGAETGTSAHHVDDEGGELGRGYVGYAFLFETDARRG